MSIKLSDLLVEYRRRLLEDEREDAVAALNKAFKAGPAATRAFLDGPIGSSDLVRTDILMSPEEDGASDDDPVTIGSVSGAPASGFKPTQSEIDLMKSVSWPLGSVGNLIDAIKSGPVAKGIVVSDDLIIDGHHRWSGAYAIGGANAKVSGKDVKWPGASQEEKLAAAQLAIAAKLGQGKKTPSQSEGFDTNIMGKSADGITKMIMANINKKTDPNAPGALLNDKMIKNIITGADQYKEIFDWLGIEPLKQDDGVKNKDYKIRIAIAQKVGENLANLPNNPEAPARKDMPQFDDKVGGPPLDTVEPEIKSGKYNIAPPFGESIDKSRWKKIANIKRK